MTTLLAIGGAAFLASIVATPLVRAAALHWRLTDRPDGHRKLHEQAIPLGGGIAILAGALAAIVLACLADNPFQTLLADQFVTLVALLAASLIIVLVGLADDRYGLRGRHKLLGQLAAAIVLLPGGLMIRHISLFDQPIELGLVAIPFTLFWLLGSINSVNLIDGIDGLATTVGIILSSAIAVMAMLTGHQAEALLAVAFTGSLVGFLCFNRPPARIFLGDAGSMLIGLVVGALAIRATLKGPATVALAAPLAVWAIPIFDSTAAIVRRKLTGRSIYTTDRGHLHHCLLVKSGTNLRVLGWIALCCALTCAGALLSVWLHSDLLALLSAATVVATLVVSRAFGHAELLLLTSRLKSAGLSLFSPFGGLGAPGAAQHSAVRLQGSRPWELLWESLAQFADKLNLASIRLDVNAPAVQEGYHAAWRRNGAHKPDELWVTEIPLFAGDRSIGRLTVSGHRDGLSACELVERLMDLLQPFELQLTELAQLEQHRAAAPGQSAQQPAGPPAAVEAPPIQESPPPAAAALGPPHRPSAGADSPGDEMVHADAHADRQPVATAIEHDTGRPNGHPH